MKKMIYTLSALSLLTTSAQSVELDLKENKFEVNGQVSVFLGQKVDTNGAKTTKLNGGGNEIEFKFAKEINEDIKIFSKIQLGSNAFSSDGKGAVNTDDIVFGIQHKQYGQLFFSKNNDDPVEKYIAEALGYGKFLNVSEASTISSKNNQIQYKTPKFNNFNIIAGFSNNPKEDINKTHKSLVVKYANKDYGFSLGGGKNATRNEIGATAWYKIDNTTLNILTFADNKNSIKTEYNGIGLSYKMNQKSKLKFAIQTVRKSQKKSRIEKSLGYSYALFKEVTFVAEVIKLGKENNEDDLFGLGLMVKF